MTDNYEKIVTENHKKLFENLPSDLEINLPSENQNNNLIFKAFGETCSLNSDGIFLNKVKQTGVPGILLSLYALNAKPDKCISEPFKAFKEFPNTMPYAGAFATHTENILVPHVDKIRANQEIIKAEFSGYKAPSSISGDFSFVLHPLPKIALCYIFYEADEDFPPSVTCLYSNNANLFMPNDALADVGEYTSKKIIQILNG